VGNSKLRKGFRLSRDIKTCPVYAHIGTAILCYVTLREAEEMVSNGSAERIRRRGFALRLTGHKIDRETGQVRDRSCYMDDRIVHANACGDPRAMGMVAAWAVNHAGLCPVVTQ
jgi:hypothetical protein